MAGIISQLEREERAGEARGKPGEVTRAQLLREAECPVCLQEMVHINIMINRMISTKS